MPEVENLIPVFPVRDLVAAKTFYQDGLGFTLDWDAGTICSVSRDGHGLMLGVDCGAASPAMAWMGLETDALMTRAIARGLEIVQEPRNESFAYHMKIKDPDGNVLWLGTEPRGSEAAGSGD